MTTDLRASILAEAAEIAMHHPSKDAQAFACSVTDFLTSPVAPEQGTDAIAFALKWPGEARLNLSTVFDTEAEAIDWLTRCAPGVVVVPLFAASPEAAPAAMDTQRPVTVEEDAALRKAARSSSEVVARGRLAATPAAPSAVTDDRAYRKAWAKYAAKQHSWLNNSFPPMRDGRFDCAEHESEFQIFLAGVRHGRS